MVEETLLQTECQPEHASVSSHQRFTDYLQGSCPGHWVTSDILMDTANSLKESVKDKYDRSFLVQ
jgi:hypothetical protein